MRRMSGVTNISMWSVHSSTVLWMKIYIWSNPNSLRFQEKIGLNMCANLKRACMDWSKPGERGLNTLTVFWEVLSLNSCMSDPCVYVNASKYLIVAVYVDDILAFGTEAMINVFKTRIKERLNVRMLGTDTQFLSIHLSKSNSTTVVFDQSVQISQMLDLFDITHEAGVSTPLAKECGA